MAATAVPFTHPFTRAEYYAITSALDPNRRYELLNGIIYALSPANPPHASIVRYVASRLRALDPTHSMLSVQDVLEIEPDGSPQPDIAVLRFRGDFYSTAHPNGADALLVVEVSDSERNPREKMRDYMRDGRIPSGWRIDIPARRIELWSPTLVEEPCAIVQRQDTITFQNVTIVVDEVFAGIAPS